MLTEAVGRGRFWEHRVAMQEMTVRIRFLSPSLGHVRRRSGSGVVFGMIRDRETKKVVFLPAWWRSICRYAAQLLGQPVDVVDRIDWDPVIEGQPRLWRRYLELDRKRNRRPYAVHEAFGPGDVIGVNCVLPTRLTSEDLWRLLDLAGRYKGISPFTKPDEDYGKFVVVSVVPRRRVG